MEPLVNGGGVAVATALHDDRAETITVLRHIGSIPVAGLGDLDGVDLDDAACLHHTQRVPIGKSVV